MKKIFVSLMLAVAACTATYANGNVKDNTKSDATLSTTLHDLKQKIAGAPSGTTYGVTGRNGGNIVVNTPLGKYTIKRLKVIRHDLLTNGSWLQNFGIL